MEKARYYVPPKVDESRVYVNSTSEYNNSKQLVETTLLELIKLMNKILPILDSLFYNNGIGQPPGPEYVENSYSNRPPTSNRPPMSNGSDWSSPSAWRMSVPRGTTPSNSLGQFGPARNTSTTYVNGNNSNLNPLKGQLPKCGCN